MSNNPYCMICYETLGLNDGFDPEIKKNVIIDELPKNSLSQPECICIDCLLKIQKKFCEKYFNIKF